MVIQKKNSFCKLQKYFMKYELFLIITKYLTFQNVKLFDFSFLLLPCKLTSAETVKT